MVAVLNHPESRATVRGRPLRHAAYSQPLLLIDEEDLPTARAAGLALVDPPTILLHHLQQLVKRHASELLTRDATRHLVEETRRSTPAVVEELIPEVMKLADVQRILQRLLVEGVSIRQLSMILEALGDEATRTTSELERTELVRRRLARTICARFRDARDRLQVVTLDPALEERVQRAVQRNRPRGDGPVVVGGGGELLSRDRPRIGVVTAAGTARSLARASGNSSGRSTTDVRGVAGPDSAELRRNNGGDKGCFFGNRQ